MSKILFGNITHVLQSKAKPPGFMGERSEVTKRFDAYVQSLREQNSSDPNYQVCSFGLKPNARLVIDSQNDDLKNVAYEIFLENTKQQAAPLNLREAIIHDPHLVAQGRYERAEYKVLHAHLKDATVLDLDA